MQSYSNHVYLYSYSSKNENLQWYKQTGVGNFKATMCKFHIFFIFYTNWCRCFKIHTYVTNPLYFLIIKLYKVKLYL